MDYPIPKGTFDILPFDPQPDAKWRSSHLWHYVEKKIHEVMEIYGFQEIRTPIFERTELFVRGVGESSDIVTKEMYTFDDKAGRSMTLRPEGTASTLRAFVEKRLNEQPTLHKYYYIGPMFRYERPQAGRYRQFHQFGFEAIGSSAPQQDVEVIEMLCVLYEKLGLKNLSVEINSIGSKEAREEYKRSLRLFLTPHFDKLSEESKLRFEKNILRILDSKDKEDRALLEKAPLITDFLSSHDLDHFQRVLSLLQRCNISYTLKPQLVRGLDYYNHTVFEVSCQGLGAQNALGGGGRYDGLTADLGGKDLPAIGFAAGMERTIQLMLLQNSAHIPKAPHPTLFLIPIGEKACDVCFSLLFDLRHEGIACETAWHIKKVAAALQLASAMNATYALVIGEEELQTEKIKLKHLENRTELPLHLKELSSFLKTLGGNLAIP